MIIQNIKNPNFEPFYFIGNGKFGHFISKLNHPVENFAKPAWLLQQGVAKGLALGGMMDELANDKMAFFRLPITHSLLCGHLSNPTFMVPTG